MRRKIRFAYHTLNRTQVFARLLLTLLLLPCTQAFAQARIYHQKIDRSQDSYMLGLLKLGLSYSDRDYSFQEDSEVLSRTRLTEMVATGERTVMWTGGSRQMEAKLLPVRIPAYKGLMGHRVFLIRQGDQARFDRIETLDDLRYVKLGQGHTWADTAILKSAGLNVVTALKTPGLFYMLEGGRFDAFPRGVHEPWQEMRNYAELNLTVEKGLVLIYTMPYYLYFSPSEEALARDVESGLEKAIADGSFDRYFFADPDVRNALERAQLKSRRVLNIDNPNLSSKTPIDRPELWLDINDL
ncbi:diguanylate cyclase [Teredinibacter turnerae]|uniref:diguanylate cyclase n=1 Tax=Teredinibacter turnerae TaxID=2426 RepID=UPI0030D147D9